jgi:hypothetical protein
MLFEKVISKNAIKCLAKLQVNIEIKHFQKSTPLSAIWKSRFSAFLNRFFFKKRNS